MAASPRIIVLAGPHGAGKSTAASMFPPPAMTFINADEIAKSLPAYPPPSTDLHAGRLALERMDDLERSQTEFAVETTFASRSLAQRIACLRQEGYYFQLIFLYLPGPELAVQRVAGRVLLGGHNIPTETAKGILADESATDDEVAEVMEELSPRPSASINGLVSRWRFGTGSMSKSPSCPRKKLRSPMK